MKVGSWLGGGTQKFFPGYQSSPGKVRGTEPEPTGVEFSVTNFLTLPYPVWGIVSKAPIPAD
jgi:hypothetical protein